MVIHHLLYNLTTFLGAPRWVFTNPVFDVLHYFFAGLFIFLSGISSRFSRSNIKRGLIVIAVAAGISAVTYQMSMPIWFGILHLLGFLMLFFGLTGKLWNKIPRLAAPFIYIALIVATALLRAHFQLTSEHLWLRNGLAVSGWRQPGRFNRALLPWHPDFVFGSYDYFPLLPWMFVFLLGTWAGLYIREGKLPGRFYDATVPVFPAIGRKALIVYILHQPVLYGLVMGIVYLTA
jgi:uncharacterized membrane protein